MAWSGHIAAGPHGVYVLQRDGREVAEITFIDTSVDFCLRRVRDIAALMEQIDALPVEERAVQPGVPVKGGWTG